MSIKTREPRTCMVNAGHELEIKYVDYTEVDIIATNQLQITVS